MRARSRSARDRESSARETPFRGAFFAAIFLAIAAFFLAIFLALLLFNVVALAIELAIVIIVALVGLISRVVFRRPWIVFAKSGDQQVEYPVVGYFNSKRRVAELATALSSGAQLPTGHR